MVLCEDISGISGAFSAISLCSWVCAQLPQIYANYKYKSAEGISPLFLLLWFLGDFLSLTSCLLNDVVLKFQVYLSAFFICNDITLCFQYYYYTSVYPRTHYALQLHEERVDHSSPNASDIPGSQGGGGDDQTQVSAGGADLHLTNSIPIHRHHPHSEENEYLASSESPSYNSTGTKSLLAGIALNAATTTASPLEKFSTNVSYATGDFTQSLGLFLAWSCTAVYISSRCPQLYKNYKRKSVDGISPLLFGSALMGNLTYTLSILTSCKFVFAEDRTQFLMKELPYILGSAGTIVFDAVYFYQRYVYRDSGINTQVMGMEDWNP